MDSVRTVVLAIASLVTVIGILVVARRELTAPERRRVGSVRDSIEVLLPVVGVIVLVAIVWAAV